jgi:NADPH-dependent 2,4-dienoyl-CoA reductase/sulfur reductase-like enzyme
VPPEWLAAVGERGYAYFLFATRAWPEAEPGKPVEPESLAAFAGNEEILLSAAHVLLPAHSLRG